MKKPHFSYLFIVDVLLAAIFVVWIVYLFEVDSNNSAVSAPNQQVVQNIQSQQPVEPLTLLYATTSAEQELGLGQRNSLPADEGMLFIFPTPGDYAFWMKDMHFSIDMIWMDSNFTITYIAADVSPGTYPETFSPGADSSYVLETNAGYSQKNNLSVGETLDFVKNSVDNTQ